jgi:hypothetical protein
MPRREWQSDRLASAKSRLSNQTPGVPFTHGQLKAALKNPGRACQFWSEQRSRFAPKQPHLKLSAQILTLSFADTARYRYA